MNKLTDTRLNHILERVFDNNDIFKRYIDNHYNLKFMIALHLANANRLMEKVLNNVDIFKKIINGYEAFIDIAKAFPNYAYISSKSTLQEVLIQIKTDFKESKENIKNAVITFTQGRRAGHDFFKLLPDELIAEIAANSGTNNFVQKEKAKERGICYPFWNKPIVNATFSQELLDIVPPSLD